MVQSYFWKSCINFWFNPFLWKSLAGFEYKSLVQNPTCLLNVTIPNNAKCQILWLIWQLVKSVDSPRKQPCKIRISMNKQIYPWACVFFMHFHYHPLPLWKLMKRRALWGELSLPWELLLISLINLHKNSFLSPPKFNQLPN